jgi:hypothetical protein
VWLTWASRCGCGPVQLERPDQGVPDLAERGHAEVHGLCACPFLSRRAQELAIRFGCSCLLCFACVAIVAVATQVRDGGQRPLQLSRQHRSATLLDLLLDLHLFSLGGAASRCWLAQRVAHVCVSLCAQTPRATTCWRRRRGRATRNSCRFACFCLCCVAAVC